MESRITFFLVAFISIFSAIVVCFAGLEVLNLEMTQFRKDALIIGGTLAFLCFIGWLDAITDFSNAKRKKKSEEWRDIL